MTKKKAGISAGSLRQFRTPLKSPSPQRRFHNLRRLVNLIAAGSLALALIVLDAACNPEVPVATASIVRLGLTTLDNRVVSNEDIAGRVVLIEFWTSWCGPCRKASPHIEGLYEKYAGRDFMVFGVNEGEPPLIVRKYVNRHRIKYPVAFSDGRLERDVGGINSIPVFVLLDRKGQLQARYNGFSKRVIDDLDRKIAFFLTY